MEQAAKEQEDQARSKKIEHGREQIKKGKDTTNVTTISAVVQPASVPESHNPTATSKELPQPFNDTNERKDVPISNDTEP